MSFFALSKLFSLAVAVGCALGAFSPPRFAMTSWDKPPTAGGVRIYGSTPDRGGILELSHNGYQDEENPTAPYLWHASIHLLGTVVTANGSDFAAISEQSTGTVSVFFIRENGALAFASSPSSAAGEWSLGLVGGNPAPAPGTNLAAARWGPNHISVFYQDAEGLICESELKNNTWASPVGFATANVGTDLSAWGKTTEFAGFQKFVYLQTARRFQVWSCTNGRWAGTLLNGIPVQPSVDNVRFALSYLPWGGFESRLFYKSTAAGKISESRGTLESWTFNGDLANVSNMPAASDIAATVQLGHYAVNWVFVVYTGPDGTLQQEVMRGVAGWSPPTQIATAANKVNRTA